jgi:hypothetical protein
VANLCVQVSQQPSGMLVCFGPVLYRLDGQPSGTRPTQTSRGAEVCVDRLWARGRPCGEADPGLSRRLFCTRRVLFLRIFRRTLETHVFCIIIDLFEV